MFDAKNISPLLDGFTLGTPISEHHGVVCCPAIKENSNKKYIVKIITVPATQAQFDALILAGAYKDPADAMEYFRTNGEDILKEAELLKTLSRIEGFLTYDNWQMEPIARRRLGYEIYLVGSYKRSLEKYIRKNAVTHLEAVNLALDLCAALSLSRQSGYLYADLKPSNIFISEKKEYRIGDLGFLDLKAMRYASLPERYFSPYTPPELRDPMAPMNLTVDTYAVGMILYQLYNDGHLPFKETAPLDELPPPCHADYEMAEIIMKAIHTDPVQRWSDPKDLGKAIASYMQRNSVNDIPITPFIPVDVKPEDIITLPSQPVSQETEEIAGEALQESAASSEIPETEMIDKAKSETEIKEESELQSDESPLCEANASDESEAADISPMIPEDTENIEEETDSADSLSGEDDDQEKIVIEDVSEEVAKILSKADDIIAHEIPEETAYPKEEPVDLFSFAAEEDLEEDYRNYPEDPLMEDAVSSSAPDKRNTSKHFENTSRKKKILKFFTRCLTVFILLIIAAGGFWFYRNIFLQTIDSITISGTQTQITVLVDSSVEESKLIVHCTDENGKQKSGSVQGGKVVFSDLKPSTQYHIQLDMTGFHKLTGHTSEMFTTEATTQVLSFHAIAGSEDGSVMLDFTVDGNEPDFWNIRYLAEGEEELVETITSHSAMITGLTIGKVYTFTLDGGKNFDLGGETSLQFLASKLILAENLTLSSSNGRDVTVQWDTPGDVVVDNWNVRCHDGYGFEVETTVTDNSALFTGLDPESHYTIAVTAAGMTQPSEIEISNDPIILSGFQVEEHSKTELKVTWEYTGNPPEGGWQLQYSVDGSGSQVITCEKNFAEISPLIPGANYKFNLQAADGRTVFNNTDICLAEEAAAFTEHNFIAENVTFNLVKTPEDPKWSFETISENDFTNTFRMGDSASMVMQSSSGVYTPSNKVAFLFVFRDSYGNVLTELVSEQTHTWKNIWMAGDVKTGELAVPALPSSPGAYQMELYCNGGFMTTLDITITE